MGLLTISPTGGVMVQVKPSGQRNGIILTKTVISSAAQAHDSGTSSSCTGRIPDGVSAVERRSTPFTSTLNSPLKSS